MPKGTIVEVFSLEDPKTARDGIVRRVGVAGIDLVKSWHWTPGTRNTQRSLPIDRYRSLNSAAAVNPCEETSAGGVPEYA